MAEFRTKLSDARKRHKFSQLVPKPEIKKLENGIISYKDEPFEFETERVR